MSLIGSVKFFDTKKGWGFITVLTQDLPQSNSEVFVHFSNLNVQGDSYKRLFPGEYVSFSMGKSDRGKDTCIDVCGVMGGPLLTDHPEHRYKIYPKNYDNHSHQGGQSNRSSEARKPENENEEGGEDPPAIPESEDAQEAESQDENDPEA
jgi:cold shock CspA family protein